MPKVFLCFLHHNPTPSYSLPKKARYVLAETHTARLKPKSVPKTIGKKESLAPALVLPTTGLSVNPGHEAFEDQVEDVFSTEVAKLREEEELKKKHAQMTAMLQNLYTDEELKNMDNLTKLREYKKMVGLDEDEEDEENATGNKDGKSSKKKSDRKTKAERNRSDRVKKAGREVDAERLAKKLEKSIGHVPTMIREMQKEQKERDEEKAYIASKKKEEDELEEKGRGVFSYVFFCYGDGGGVLLKRDREAGVVLLLEEGLVLERFF